MKLLCRWFGHKYGEPFKVFSSSGLSWTEYKKCKRCGVTRITDMSMFHLPIWGV